MRLVSCFALALLTPSAARGDVICLGDAAIDTGSEQASRQDGPDFVVWTFGKGPGTVSVYTGCCSEVSTSAKMPFLTRDGYRVDLVSGKRGNFYVKAPGGEYHFFGPGLNSLAAARLFFTKVRFGRNAREGCRADH